MSDAKSVLKMIKDKEVKFVDIRFTDTRGKEQHVQVPIKQFTKDKFESGHAFDGSSIAGWKGIEASDMLLMPDPSTAFIDPFFQESTLVLSCDVLEPGDGKAYDRDPRALAALQGEARVECVGHLPPKNLVASSPWLANACRNREAGAARKAISTS